MAVSGDIESFSDHLNDFLRDYNWLGNDHKQKLIYRASQYGYTNESFHQHCDDKSPTLVIIKTTKAGYITQSWMKHRL